mmetsp:Transcript_65625/g.122349  ORF Transcript_65625/g.122349 Transcript_65625/m.122349 type:complete len:349 (+) Transcript_65625:48-1094(+)
MLMAQLPQEKCLRRAPSGHAIFCTLNGSQMLQANLCLLGGTQIVDWVRKETGVRRLHVVHGTHALPEASTFHQLRDQDVLNIIFDSTDLPVLELHAVGCRGTGRVDIDLAHHRTLEDLQKEIQDFMQRLPCARWQLQHEEHGPLLQSDQPPPSLLVDDWVALLRWQGAKRFRVMAREMLPRVCIRFSCWEEQWVDLDAEQVCTCSALLQLVRRLAESLVCNTPGSDGQFFAGHGLDNWIFRLQRSCHQAESWGVWISDDDRYRHQDNLAAHGLEVNEVLYVRAVLQENALKRQAEGSRGVLKFGCESNKRLRRLDATADCVHNYVASFQAALHEEMDNHACKRLRCLV